MKSRIQEQPDTTSPAHPRRARKRRHGAAPRPARQYPQHKTIEELAAEQGVKPRKWDEVVGMGADLWSSDAEFEEFVRGIRDRRQQDLRQCR